MNKEYIIMNNQSLKLYNSMRIDAKADKIILPFTIKGTCDAIYDYFDKQPIFLGSGSNIIFSKERYSCPIICTSLLKNIYKQDGVIVSDAGVSLSSLSWFAMEQSIYGYEFLEDIPGSIGGALYMNAGTYEDTIGDRVLSIIIYDCVNNNVKELKKEELMPWWGKRNSYFQNHSCFIIQAKFDASNVGNCDEILDKMLETKKKRYMKQPRNYPNAGSVFKRPYVNGEPRYIWKLFDEAGLRGHRIGEAQVSEKHPGFIVNIGNATGKDVVDLMNYCKQVIWKKYGIKIEEEWRIV